MVIAYVLVDKERQFVAASQQGQEECWSDVLARTRSNPSMIEINTSAQYSVVDYECVRMRLIAQFFHIGTAEPSKFVLCRQPCADAQSCVAFFVTILRFYAFTIHALLNIQINIRHSKRLF